MPILSVSDPSLVLLIGAAGSGKSTFAARHFAPGETLSSDALRAAISGDAADQSASKAAFAALYGALDRRLKAGRLTVVDATNLTRAARRPLLIRAEAAQVPVFAIVLDLAPELVLARSAARLDRVVPESVVRRHLEEVRRLADERSLEREGFAAIQILHDPAAVEALRIRRESRV
jgi:protein phosphatase